jgi:plastocyanin
VTVPRSLTLAGLAACVLAVPALAATPKLTGEVGPGFTIEVEQGGKDVKALKAGTYTILVQDKSSMHDFHLSGPGVDKKTGVSFTGKQTWKVTLRKGTYRYVCDPHSSQMKGSFRVS